MAGNEINLKPRTCAEPGCEEPTWNDSRYCPWHPRVLLADDDNDQKKTTRKRCEDPWANPCSAQERTARPRYP